jgi:hypothetical protein
VPISLTVICPSGGLLAATPSTCTAANSRNTHYTSTSGNKSLHLSHRNHCWNRACRSSRKSSGFGWWCDGTRRGARGRSTARNDRSAFSKRQTGKLTHQRRRDGLEVSNEVSKERMRRKKSVPLYRLLRSRCLGLRRWKRRWPRRARSSCGNRTTKNNENKGKRTKKQLYLPQVLLGGAIGPGPPPIPNCEYIGVLPCGRKGLTNQD